MEKPLASPEPPGSAPIPTQSDQREADRIASISLVVLIKFFTPVMDVINEISLIRQT